jgi:hypothetical protein
MRFLVFIEEDGRVDEIQAVKAVIPANAGIRLLCRNPGKTVCPAIRRLETRLTTIRLSKAAGMTSMKCLAAQDRFRDEF